VEDEAATAGAGAGAVASRGSRGRWGAVEEAMTWQGWIDGFMESGIQGKTKPSRGSEHAWSRFSSARAQAKRVHAVYWMRHGATIASQHEARMRRRSRSGSHSAHQCLNERCWYLAMAMVCCVDMALVWSRVADIQTMSCLVLSCLVLSGLVLSGLALFGPCRDPEQPHPLAPHQDS
jgi:hypothetical protein